MPVRIFLSAAAHSAMPGASDEILAAAFLLLAVAAGWWILRQKG